MLTEQAKSNRPTWTEYFFDIAHVVAKRATCPRANVGVVLVKDRRILATGYNGSPKGVDHCVDVGCRIDNGHCERAIHAETNAIAQAALHGVSLHGATCYSTHQPCRNCTKALIASGIAEIIFTTAYPDPISAWHCESAGVPYSCAS
jgi:dCMP deaminase